MNEIILLKLGEVILKGLNRNRFESTLVKNVKRAVWPYGNPIVSDKQSTIFVEVEGPYADFDGAYEACKNVFGIVSLCRAVKCSLDFEEVKKTAGDYLSRSLSKAKTFKVEAKRADKNYYLTSPQIMELLGEYLLNRFPNLSVNVKSPEVTVYAEVREGSIFIHGDPERGARGLPAGTGGHGLLMLSGGIDSPVAGYVMAKRGLKISAIHFESPPYTSDRAKEKVIALAKKLAVYAGQIDLYVVPFTDIQEAIKDFCPEEYFTVIMRRYMLKIACSLAERINAGAIITGESLGQVASQTLGAIRCTDHVSSLPVFRPFIGTDKQEIINLARKIDTFETSSLPYEDCCTVFTPRHPKTNPTLQSVEKAEEKLDECKLLEEMQDKIERITLYAPGRKDRNIAEE
ncbi:MAG: tRNA 4-thiouridine(8) synthase ThiI [Clostridia bacterium]|nr:tRNA 4-thiouridine(8) synthase ThiI [Clostridia bacterium]